MAKPDKDNIEIKRVEIEGAPKITDPGALDFDSSDVTASSSGSGSGPIPNTRSDVGGSSGSSSSSGGSASAGAAGGGVFDTTSEAGGNEGTGDSGDAAATAEDALPTTAGDTPTPAESAATKPSADQPPAPTGAPIDTDQPAPGTEASSDPAGPESPRADASQPPAPTGDPIDTNLPKPSADQPPAPTGAPIRPGGYGPPNSGAETADKAKEQGSKLRSRGFGGRGKKDANKSGGSGLFSPGKGDNSKAAASAGKGGKAAKASKATNTAKKGKKAKGAAAAGAAAKKGNPAGKVRTILNKRTGIALIVIFITILILLINYLGTAWNIFSAGRTSRAIGSYNSNNAIEFMLDVQLVYYVNNDTEGDDWQYDVDALPNGDINSPIAKMFGYWEEAYIREDRRPGIESDSLEIGSVRDHFISHVSDMFNLREDELRKKEGDIITVGRGTGAQTGRGAPPGDTSKALNWSITANNIFDKQVTIETEEVLRAVQLFRSQLVSSSDISRWNRNLTMLRLLGINNRSLFDINSIQPPEYTQNEDVEKEEDIDIIREQYIEVTEKFLRRFENQTYSSVEAAIACAFATPQEAQIRDGNGAPTGETRQKSAEEECEDQFDVRLSDTDKDIPTEVYLTDTVGLRKELIEKSFDIKFNDEDEEEGREHLPPQEKYLELAKIEREYINNVLGEVYTAAIQDFLYYWKEAKGGSNVNLLDAVDSAIESGALEQANYQYTYQTFMIYNDTIATASHELNRSDANNTEKQIIDFYLGEFSSSPVWELYRNPEPEEEAGIEVKPICIDPESPKWEPIITQLEDEELVCPEKRFRSMDLLESQNIDLERIITEQWPEPPTDDEGNPDESFWLDGIPPEGVEEESSADVDGAIKLAKLMLDSNITPLNSGRNAYEAYLAGDLALSYVIGSSRSSVDYDYVRDGGIGGTKLKVGAADGEDEQEHVLEKIYKLYDYTPYGHSNFVQDYMDYYTDPNLFWKGSVCFNNEYKANFIKWYQSGTVTVRGQNVSQVDPEICSLMIAAANVGSFSFSDLTTHRAVIREIKDIDKPYSGTEIDPPESSSSVPQGQTPESLECKGEDLPLSEDWEYSPDLTTTTSISGSGPSLGPPPATDGQTEIGTPLATIGLPLHKTQGQARQFAPNTIPTILHIMESMDNLGHDLTIGSGHRSICYNLSIGGSEHSNHIAGLAVDFGSSNDDSLYAAAEWVDNNIPGVWADVHGTGANLHLHISFRGEQYR